ncbi:MAG: hypothetical protein R2865_09955 [Deinococcales bacterium]
MSLPIFKEIILAAQTLFCTLFLTGCPAPNVEPPVVINLNPQHSVARYWNDALLQAIREDFARPTVHARNLFHSAIASYDAWAVYDDTAETYLWVRQ